MDYLMYWTFSLIAKYTTLIYYSVFHWFFHVRLQAHGRPQEKHLQYSYNKDKNIYVAASMYAGLHTVRVDA